MINELGNFKQKNFTFQNVNFFLHFTATNNEKIKAARFIWSP